MTKISVSPDCKSAPKKAFIKDFNIAYATGDANFIIDHVSDDIVWNLHGGKNIKGKKEFSKEVNIMKDYTTDEVVIHSIITHGTEGAANGEMKMGDSTYVFCDVYRFTGAGSNIIKQMDSYVIKIN